MSLKSLVKNLSSDEAADAVVDHIFNDFFSMGKEGVYLEKYFDQDVRRAVFSGGTISGRYVLLSPAAAMLKSALQRRHVKSNGSRFPPIKAYHRTSGRHIAGLIAETGFIETPTTVCGRGVCFFTGSQKADGYSAPLVEDPKNPGNAALNVVLEVTIFSRFAELSMPSGADLVTYYRRSMDVMVVKNPLVIFPTAVFSPGEKLANMKNAGL